MPSMTCCLWRLSLFLHLYVMSLGRSTANLACFGGFEMTDRAGLALSMSLATFLAIVVRLRPFQGALRAPHCGAEGGKASRHPGSRCHTSPLPPWLPALTWRRAGVSISLVFTHSMHCCARNMLAI